MRGKIERGEKTPTPKISALLRKRPVLLRANETGGRSAELFQHHRRHATVQRLEVVAISLPICPALVHFFSEKFPGDNEVWADRVNLDVQPELGALRFNDVNVSPVDGSEHCPGQAGHPLESGQG